MNDWLGIVFLVVLLAGNAFFVGAEFAVISARRSQIEPLAEAGSGRAKTTLYAMEHISLMLACAQLGITVFSLLILNVAEPSIKRLILIPLKSLGVPEEVSYPLSFVLVLCLVSFLHVTLGEMVPKNISVSFADTAALILAPPLVAISRVVKPIITALNWAANQIVRFFGVEPKDEVVSSFTADEVQSILDESTRYGSVADTTGLLSGSLEFSELTSGDLMVPLAEVETLPVTATPADVEAEVRKTGFSRFVLTDTVGDLVGYVHIKDILGIPEAGYQHRLSESRIHSLLNVRMDTEVEDTLHKMQASGAHLARVISPEGEAVGVLFLEDILEELVGEIRERARN